MCGCEGGMRSVADEKKGEVVQERLEWISIDFFNNLVLIIMRRR